MNILDDIVAYKQQLLKDGYYDEKFKTLPHVDVHQKPTLQQRLRQSHCIEVIAEIKSKSPTVNDIPHRSLEEQVKAYTEGGAAAISILTDEHYFHGSFERLATLSPLTPCPVLCKDFIIDERQIDVAKRAGASIILLIVYLLTDTQLKSLYDYATMLGLEVIVEVHSIEELARAHRLQPNLIGVNNRDLQRFVTNVAHTNEILSHAKRGIHYISESGIQHQSHVEKIQPSGIRGVLVGEALMKSESPRELIQSLKIQRG
ncbi:indole-3-glycerol phosphate synthase TrpC [Staphylococcus hyicus]|uniref:Indole-3-glycerol phosphate synthase n=1 Tax=Staphylococcus hyicus TaxID=1284 RepID=A0A418JMD0_STAHY|nr:indole-3-glycerol phosphate synthase TrpC [Staphylococcus hyicus]NJH81639.1 indole-3-glycerol phosphate synthase TrpC [Staphylococcus hyicus]RIO47701.1 indole-3-glycerol phosphate synthase TrpC [Staphylococcus hyicus]